MQSEPCDPTGSSIEFDEILEIGVGTAILGLRRINIARRELVQAVPAAEPAIDAALDQLDALAGPLSHALGAVVTAVGDAITDTAGPDHAEAMRRLGSQIAELGPELVRLSGLTHRD